MDPCRSTGGDSRPTARLPWAAALAGMALLLIFPVASAATPPDSIDLLTEACATAAPPIACDQRRLRDARELFERLHMLGTLPTPTEAPLCDCWDNLESAHGPPRIDCDIDFDWLISNLEALVALDYSLRLLAKEAPHRVQAVAHLMRTEAHILLVDRAGMIKKRSGRACRVVRPERSGSGLSASMPSLPDRCSGRPSLYCDHAERWLDFPFLEVAALALTEAERAISALQTDVEQITELREQLQHRLVELRGRSD